MKKNMLRVASIGILGAAVGAAFVGATAIPALAATSNGSDSVYYLYDAGTEALIAPGQQNAFDTDLVGSPSGGGAQADARSPFHCSADAMTVRTFIAPVGKEKTPSSWVAYADGGFNPGTTDILESNANLSGQILGSPASVRSAGGAYSLGVACLKDNSVNLAGSGIWFAPITVTAGTGAWSYALSTLPALTSVTPTVTGTARVGSTLTAKSGTWGPAPVTLTYQWSANGVKIAGATAKTYVVGAAYAGKTLTFSVTGSKAGYATSTKTSAATAAVAKGVLTTVVPTISGSAVVGSKLTAVTGAWGPSPVVFTYQWNRNGVAISGATQSIHTVNTSDRGKAITVTVTGTKTGYTTAAKTSAAVTAK